ncbi:MAG TPA: hypothetical protein VHP30_14215, partial [Ignavibacteriales bacterium]|nr:hypothetical protein [Ignavibacteriales bacterium]
MKKTLLLIILLCPFLTFTRAQQEADMSVLTATQALSPFFNLRIESSDRASSGPYGLYLHNVNWVVRQDYGNSSRYVVSLNPALWGIEYGLMSMLADTSLPWTMTFPMIVCLGDVLANLKFDIYWVHLGWNTDFYIYDKKFVAVFEIEFGLKYVYKNWGLSLVIKGPNPDSKYREFFPPWEKRDGVAALSLSYNFNEAKVPIF